MKQLALITLLIIGSPATALAKQDTLYFDPVSGNYVIQYTGRFLYVRDAEGTIRPFDKDEGLQEREELIERDSLVTVIFEPATKIEPSVTCEVFSTGRNDRHVYSYRLENATDAQQNLFKFIVEFGEGVEMRSSTTNSWMNVRQMEMVENDVVPAYRWAWTGVDGIPPGGSLEGFALEATGLPDIVNAYFRGKTEVLTFPTEAPGGELGVQIAALRVFPANHIVRRTISSIGAPETLVPLSFLDRLIAFKDESLTLGWINNKGVANSLNAKLENVKKNLEKGKTKTAKNALKAFLNEVEAQKDKHLSSEAYALLKFNGEFLLSKL